MSEAVKVVRAKAAPVNICACKYCGEKTGTDSRRMATESAWKRLKKKKGLRASRPLCVICLGKLYQGDIPSKIQPTSAAAVATLKRACAAITGVPIDPRIHTHIISDALSVGREQMEEIDSALSAMFQEMELLTNRRNECSSQISILQTVWTSVEMKSYRERRKRANAAITDIRLRESIFNRDGNQCVLCPSVEELSIDHIVSVKCGGGNEPENLQTLCRSCNSRKGSALVSMERGSYLASRIWPDVLAMLTAKEVKP